MARKQKRKAARNRPRPTTAAPGTAAPTAPAAPVSRGPARTGGGESLVRSVEMTLSPRAAGAGRRGQRTLVLDGDPAIPLDRVPYFLSDLGKLGIVALAMLVLLVVGSQVISRVVH